MSMKFNFVPSLAAVLIHEGGYVNDPQDPGGATNKGVTQPVYDDWRIGEKLSKRSVQLINAFEVGEIYRRRYWNATRGDDLPSGVDYCVFDFAVNSGVNRATRYLQRAAGVNDDGQIGSMTLAAVKAKPSVALIEQICAARLNFLRQLPTFARFGKGWTARVEDVAKRAKDMLA
jgi:lysozyme family protein